MVLSDVWSFIVIVNNVDPRQIFLTQSFDQCHHSRINLLLVSPHVVDTLEVRPVDSVVVLQVIFDTILEPIAVRVEHV